MFNLPPIQIETIKYNNSAISYIEYYLNYINNKKFIPKNEEDNDYNHVEFFARIYYWAIKIFAKSFANNSKKGVIIHDIGSNTAYLPFLLSILNQIQLMGLNIQEIIASDLNCNIQPLISNIHQTLKEYKPIKFLKINMITEADKIPLADASLINDVLEHLPNEKLSFKGLQNAWEKTKSILFTHVPLEEIPNAFWEHNISFNPKKLRNWGSKLKDAEIISDQYFEDDGRSLTEHGYLILKRKSPTSQ